MFSTNLNHSPIPTTMKKLTIPQLKSAQLINDFPVM